MSLQEGPCFQHTMSLKGSGMLRIDDQRARNREIDSGTDKKFLLATEEVRFEASKRAEVYSWLFELLLC
jgi:hypothetical protein